MHKLKYCLLSTETCDVIGTAAYVIHVPVKAKKPWSVVRHRHQSSQWAASQAYLVNFGAYCFLSSVTKAGLQHDTQNGRTQHAIENSK